MKIIAKSLLPVYLLLPSIVKADEIYNKVVEGMRDAGFESKFNMTVSLLWRVTFIWDFLLIVFGFGVFAYNAYRLSKLDDKDRASAKENMLKVVAVLAFLGGLPLFISLIFTVMNSFNM